MALALVSRSPRLGLFFAASLSLAGGAGAAWDLTSVEDMRGAELSSARFDPAGMPAIAYGTRSLLYATFDGATWSVEMVTPGCDGERGASLVFDPGGNPAISYVDDAGAVRIARRSGTSWLLDTIDASVAVDGATSLAFDPAGNPAVAYHDTANADLRYARFDGSAWTATTVDGATSQVGEYASLGFAGGQPVISYYDRDNHDLKAAWFDGSNWRIEVVDGTGTLDAGRWSSLAVDPGGAPAISYVEGGGIGGDVKYAHYNASSSTWDIEYVTSRDSAHDTSLGFDGAGSPAIACYQTNDSGRLRYLTRGPAGWTGTTVDSFGVGYQPSLTFDPAGSPGISYIDGDSVSSSIKFAHGNAGGFSLYQVDSDGPQRGSVAFDSAGNAGLSYFDGSVGGLKFARFDGFDWADELVNRGFYSGNASSLVFDAALNPLIAYDDRDRGNLKLARWNGSSWVTEVVDAGAYQPTLDMMPSLALDPAGHPAIAYRWSTGVLAFELRLARFDGSTWSRETAVTGLDYWFDEGRALAFDPAGRPAITFEDTSYVIRLATRNALGGWDIEMVGPERGVVASLVFDGAGNPVIAHVGSASWTVQVARRTGTTWRQEAIASNSLPGTVAIDPRGHPVVSYVDRDTFELKVARWDGTTWRHESITTAYTAGSVAVSPQGHMAVVYLTRDFCRGPEVALDLTVIPAAAVHRGVVPSLAPGWQTVALPLTAQNDDETPPFPAAVSLPGSLSNPSPPAVPLVLYRMLRAGSTNTGNALQAVKGAGGAGVTLSF